MVITSSTKITLNLRYSFRRMCCHWKHNIPQAARSNDKATEGTIGNLMQSSTSLHIPEIMALARMEIHLLKFSKSGTCSCADDLDIASRNSKQTLYGYTTKNALSALNEGICSIPRPLFHQNRTTPVKFCLRLFLGEASYIYTM